MKLTKKRVAEEIRNARRDMHITQAELADKINVSRATISNIEQVKQAVTINMFCDIAVSLDIDPVSLLNRILSTSKSIDLSPDIKDIKIRKMIEEAVS